MRNLKKVLSLALALVMLLGMMMVGAGAADTGFEDDGTIKDSFKTAAAVNKALGLMTGDGTNLNPTANITRAEAFILSLRVDGSNANEFAKKWPVVEKPFNDVSTGKWYASYMAYGKEMGLIAGNNGNYRPDEEVSVRDFSILLLGKLGFDPASYQGAGYTTNSLRDAVKVGLYENLGNVNGDHVLTREEACQMVFQALIYSPEGGMIYPIVNGDKTMEFDNMKDAALYAAVMDGWTVGEPYASTAGSLGEKAFGLKPSATVDSLGRATTTWTANGGVKVVVNNSAPAKTYTGAVKASDIYKDLGLTTAITGNTSATDKNTWFVDGVNYVLGEPAAPANKVTPHPNQVGSGDHNKSVDYGAFGFTLSSTSTQVLGDNSCTTEVYYDGANVRIITFKTYPAQITKVNEAKDGNAASVELIVCGVTGDNGVAGQKLTVEAEGFEKDDYALVTMTRVNEGCNACITYAIKTIEPATVIEDAQVTRMSSSAVTVNGTSYEYSATANMHDSLNKTNYALGAKGSYTFVLDQNDQVILAKNHSTTTVPTNFAMLITANGTLAATDIYGVKSSTIDGDTPVVQARFVLSDGTVGTYNIKLTKHTDGKWYVWGGATPTGEITMTDDGTVESSFVSGLGTDLICDYSLSEDGKTITLKKLGTTLAAKDDVAVLSPNSAVSVGSTKMPHATATALLTNQTVYVFYNSTTKTATAYTGALPAALVAADTKAIVTASAANVGVAGVVFTTVATAPVAGASDYAYVDSSKTDKALAEDGKTEITIYTGTKLDGSKVELTAAAGVSPSGKGVFAINDKNEITAASPMTEYKATVVSNLIVVNGTAYNVTDDTQFAYMSDALTKADGNMCVVVPGEGSKANDAALVIVVRAPSNSTAVSDWKYTVAEQVTTATDVGEGKALTSLANFTDANAVKADCTASKAITIAGTGNISYSSADAASADAVKALTTFSTSDAGSTNATTANYHVVKATVTAEDGTTAAYYFVFKTT